MSLGSEDPHAERASRAEAAGLCPRGHTSDRQGGMGRENDRLYFGVGKQAGHSWWVPDAAPRELVFAGLRADESGRVGDCPFTWEVDGQLQPGGNVKNSQGPCMLHVRDGWTLIAWWDRSGADKRPGCCSAFVMRGEHTFDAMLTAFLVSFPWAYSRMRFRLTRTFF